jgi:hypothetical protein
MFDHKIAVGITQGLFGQAHRGKGAQRVDAAADLIAGLIERLALFGGEQAREILDPRFDRVGQTAEGARAFLDRQGRPCGQGRFGRCNGAVQNGRIGTGA